MSQLMPGTIFAREYRVLHKLAEGGMGAVYVVEQTSVGEQRALKVMQPQPHGVKDPERLQRYRQRFLEEARKSAGIKSAHVVKVLASGVEESLSLPYLVMELLHGETLDARLRRVGRLSLDDTLTVFRQVGHALSAAHALKVLHLDLKPENLFIAHPETPDAPFSMKVLDFGIGRVMREERDAVTATSAIGTPLWMPPEQAMQGPMTVASDVWPLGLIAYRCLTGRQYWRQSDDPGQSFAATVWLMEMMTGPIDPASVRAREQGVEGSLPPGFDAWFARCVHRDPAARFASVGELVAGLQQMAALPAAQAPTYAPTQAFMQPGYGTAPGFPHGVTTAMPAATGAWPPGTGASPWAGPPTHEQRARPTRRWGAAAVVSGGVLTGVVALAVGLGVRRTSPTLPTAAPAAAPAAPTLPTAAPTAPTAPTLPTAAPPAALSPPAVPERTAKPSVLIAPAATPTPAPTAPPLERAAPRATPPLAPPAPLAPTVASAPRAPAPVSYTDGDGDRVEFRLGPAGLEKHVNGRFLRVVRALTFNPDTGRLEDGRSGGAIPRPFESTLQPLRRLCAAAQVRLDERAPLRPVIYTDGDGDRVEFRLGPAGLEKHVNGRFLRVVRELVFYPASGRLEDGRSGGALPYPHSAILVPLRRLCAAAGVRFRTS